ncbi:MAG: bifunctional riboflavin kinase/FMN adenylyltransferase [Planctomycetes bacterium]|nr:bifunctional riboflavin kinase/FMN adenylyltransferase [Planctomycetota bacterium]
MGQRSVILIGNFDGVHLGHQALVTKAVAIAHAQPTPTRVIALTFDPNPTSVLRPGAEPPRLSTFAQRQEWLSHCGVHDVRQLVPVPELLDLSPQAFVDQVLMPLAPVAVVEGPDFHFGKGRAGTPAVLKELGTERGFAVHIEHPIEIDLNDHTLVTCSSTRIRWLLARGRVNDAARVLGRPYTIRGTVVQGDRRGRTIGVPTANVQTDQVFPALGVYAGSVKLPDGREVPAAISVSTRPTFGGNGVRLEAHLLDCPTSPHQPNLPGLPEYGWEIQVAIHSWLRDDLKLPGLDAIRAQISRDIARVRDLATTQHQSRGNNLAHA